MLLYFRQISKTVLSLIVIALIGGLIYLIVGLVQSLNYTPEKVVERYVELLESPTPDTVSAQEEESLKSIVESNLAQSIFSQSVNQVKELRKFKQKNQVRVGSVIYTSNKNYATVTLTFSNNFKNPESKTAQINLIRQGEIWTGGQRWKIYQINMPKDDSILDKLNESKDNFKLPEFKNPFGV